MQELQLWLCLCCEIWPIFYLVRGKKHPLPLVLTGPLNLSKDTQISLLGLHAVMTIREPFGRPSNYRIVIQFAPKDDWKVGYRFRRYHEPKWLEYQYNWFFVVETSFHPQYWDKSGEISLTGPWWLWSHLTPEFDQVCEENGTIAICMPLHASHLLRPLDVDCFSVLKRLYGGAVSTLTRNGVNIIYWQGRFPGTNRRWENRYFYDVHYTE